MKPKKLSKEIERIYYANADRRAINILDIGKVFHAGEEAAAKGESVEDAVKAAIERYCAPVGGSL